MGTRTAANIRIVKKQAVVSVQPTASEEAVIISPESFPMLSGKRGKKDENGIFGGRFRLNEKVYGVLAKKLRLVAEAQYDANKEGTISLPPYTEYKIDENDIARVWIISSWKKGHTYVNSEIQLGPHNGASSGDYITVRFAPSIAPDIVLEELVRKLSPAERVRAYQILRKFISDFANDKAEAIEIKTW